MQLFFLRHGKAVEPNSGEAGDDFSRALTEQGVDEIKRLAKVFKRLAVAPQAILTSPLLRAHQTAELVARSLGIKKSLAVTDLLVPGSSLQKIHTLLKPFADAEQMMLIGHEPDFSSIIGELIGGDPSSVELKKGGLALVRLEPPVRRGGGTLQWLIAPKLLLRDP